MNIHVGIRKHVPVIAGAMVLALSSTPGLGQEFEIAQLFFELNDTDGDLGIHGVIDGDDWKSLEIEGPGEQELLNVWLRGRLRRQGLTEIFFESAEPSFDELTPEQFFKRFPEGTYEIDAITLDNEEIEAESEVSHVMGAPPGNITVNGQAGAEDCDAVLPVVTAPVLVDWSPVTHSHPTIGTPNVAVTVEQYEFVAEIEQSSGTPDELSLDVILPPGVTRFRIPQAFANLSDGEVKYEIIVKLDNGNQTAVESCFELE